MAWIGTVQLDADKADVGTASVTWDSGGPDEFTYSRRAKVSGAEAAVFKADAIAARTVAATLRTQNTALGETLATLMNA